MDFEPFYNLVAYTIFVSFLVLTVPVAIVTLVSKSQKVLGVMSITIPLLALAILVSLMGTKATPTHAKNMINNIEKKYDIAFVVDDNPEYKIYPQTTSKQIVLIETKDGRQGKFALTQNRLNFEPTLHELSESEGPGAVKLEDITK